MPSPPLHRVRIANVGGSMLLGFAQGYHPWPVTITAPANLDGCMIAFCLPARHNGHETGGIRNILVCRAPKYHGVHGLTIPMLSPWYVGFAGDCAGHAFSRVVFTTNRLSGPWQSFPSAVLALSRQGLCLSGNFDSFPGCSHPRRGVCPARGGSCAGSGHRFYHPAAQGNRQGMERGTAEEGETHLGRIPNVKLRQEMPPTEAEPSLPPTPSGGNVPLQPASA
jgi:hypothetical protein